MPLTIIFQVMLRFIVNNGRCKDVGGIALWQLMEERQVLHGHSWQSMKERFRNSIVGNLDFFDFLTKEEKRELRKHKARHVLTAPLPALSVHEPQDELLADLPDPPYVPAGGERARKRSGSNLPTPPARRARLRSGSHTNFLIN
jgi:hypothetical protein